jgi:hypothetical protein
MKVILNSVSAGTDSNLKTSHVSQSVPRDTSLTTKCNKDASKNATNGTPIIMRRRTPALNALKTLFGSHHGNSADAMEDSKRFMIFASKLAHLPLIDKDTNASHNALPILLMSQLGKNVSVTPDSD